MPGNFRFILMITLFLPVTAADSQDQENLMDQEELILESDENTRIPVEIFEERQDLCLQPVDLNSASREELESSGLFTPFQVNVIIEYRERHGDLFSIYELASLTGFRVARLKEITPYLTAGSSLPVRRSHSRGHRVFIYAGRTFPEASGYKTGGDSGDPAYRGSPLKTGLKIESGLGRRVGLGLAYEKDPGEAGFHENRPEYLTGYLAYSGDRVLERLVMGSYRLHLGLGLVQGTGLIHSAGGVFQAPVTLSALKPYGGLSESGLHRGLACRLNLRPVTIMAWSSARPMDLSAGDLFQENRGIDWVSLRRESGLHRTSGEEGGRNLGYLANAGISVQVNYNNLFAGAQFSTEISGLTRKGRDSLHMDSGPSLYHSISIYWRWQKRKLETFGEYSPGNVQRCAILAGVRYHFSDFLSGCLLLHHYGTGHRETFSSAYASGSHISNEGGATLCFQAEPFGRLLADLSIELFDYPCPRHQCVVPSSGARYSFSLQNSGTGMLQWRIRYMQRIWQDTPACEQPGVHTLSEHRACRVDGRVVYEPGNRFRWQSRFIASLNRGEAATGYAAAQQAETVGWDVVKVAVQFVVFNIPQWESRIYLYEPGLYHHFDFPAYYGQGQKITAVISLKAGRRITLEVKTSVVTTYDREQTGSGNDAVEGPRRYDAEMQLRLNL
jgi:hypothetical protein